MNHPYHPVSCHHQGLAQSELGDVTVCAECGVVHLSVQCMSMRFRIAAFRELAQMLNQAERNLQDVLERANPQESHTTPTQTSVGKMH